jgi:hypothetical protein
MSQYFMLSRDWIKKKFMDTVMTFNLFMTLSFVEINNIYISKDY